MKSENDFGEANDFYGVNDGVNLLDTGLNSVVTESGSNSGGFPEIPNEPPPLPPGTDDYVIPNEPPPLPPGTDDYVIPNEPPPLPPGNNSTGSPGTNTGIPNEPTIADVIQASLAGKHNLQNGGEELPTDENIITSSANQSGGGSSVIVIILIAVIGGAVYFYWKKHNG